MFVGALLAALLVAGGAASFVVGRDGTGDARPHGPAAALELASVTDDIARNYRYAETHRKELSTIPCFCGCEEFLGHESLYDCFIRADSAYDSHAAGCGVCIGESAVASSLLDAGRPATEVAERIIEQFGTTPVTSPDQTTPRR